MPKFVQYTFTVPTLPKKWYEKVKEIAEATHLSHWHIVILAITALCEMSLRDPDWLERQIKDIRRHRSNRL